MRALSAAPRRRRRRRMNVSPRLRISTKASFAMPSRSKRKRATPSQWKTRPHQRRKDRKSTRLNSSHGYISYAVFCLNKKNKTKHVVTRNRVRASVPAEFSDPRPAQECARERGERPRVAHAFRAGEILHALAEHPPPG